MKIVEIKCKFCDKKFNKTVDTNNWFSGIAILQPYFQLVLHNMKYHKNQNPSVKTFLKTLISLTVETILHLFRIILTAICWPFVILADKLGIADISL